MSVDEYIQAYPEHFQKKLTELRNLIKDIVPEATEKISYKMPAYSLNGIIVWFGGFSKHIGFFPGADGIEEFKGELSKYKHAKGSVRFPIEEPLPAGLIKRIVEFRVAQDSKKKKK
jgi:uncharacterized protein YdhG (YjbR/CyaY superfamily)